MGRAPAYIFVVRHGNRLDAANKQWHLQSPTPYDPPLTYSGWNQARATGQKIAEILRERELQEESPTRADGSPRKRRKFQVVIHSSPFLRCVQTSIGISAGLASIPEPSLPGPNRAASTRPFTGPRVRPSINVDIPPSSSNMPSPPFSDLPTPPEIDSRPGSPRKPTTEKTVLRLDAFLGEWLTPGYFELITPPPGSSLMLASAKAGLLRKEDYSSNPNFAPYNNATSGQAWGQTPTPTSPVNSTDSSVSSLADALRRAGRSDSVTSVTSNGESRLMTGGSYVAPVPTYAISHNAEIPNGYVPHARDHCCDVDYQWDSMRGALDWGDGGSFGEEWTSMHQRFRKGLQRLVDWYSTAENPSEMVTKERRASVTDDYVMVEDEDVEVESVVILVSHGAGCNALIGAITHKPVLTDVGLASLTEAVRRPGVGDVVEDDGSARVAGDNGSSTVSEPSGLVAIHECYDLKLVASSEHLSPSRSSRAQSVSASLNPPSRGRHNSSSLLTSPLSGGGGGGGGLFSNDGSVGRSPSINVASMRRDSESSSRPSDRLGLNVNGTNGGGITVGSGVRSFLRPTPAAGGLWSPLRNTLDTPEEDDDNFLPNFSSFDAAAAPSTTAKAEATAEEAARPSTPPKSANGHETGGRNRSDSRVSPRTNANDNSDCAVREVEEEEHETVPALPQLGLGAGGLWGSPRPLEEGFSRDLSSTKRRWTVTERW